MKLKNNTRFSFLTVFILVIALNPFSTKGQNWQPFNLEGLFYISEKTVVTGEPIVSFRQNEILPLPVERTTYQGLKTIYWPPLMNGCDIRDNNSACFGGSEICSDTFSWAGRPIIQSENKWFAINRNKDTLSFTQGLHGTDTILEVNDTVYRMSKVGADETVIYGSLDSIAMYVIEVVDSNGIALSSPWHGDTVTISKSHGFIRTPAWYLFPGQESSFKLFEHEKTTQFERNDIYAYHPGDIIHMASIREKGHTDYYNVDYVETIEQCTVLTVDSTAQDIQFMMDCRYQKKIFTNSGSSNTAIPEISMDTVWWNASVLPYFQLGQIKKTTAISNSTDGLCIRQETIVHGGSSTGNCPFYQSIFEPWHSSSSILVIGIGEVHSGWFDLTDYPGYYTLFERNMTYFNSQDTVFGNPGFAIGTPKVPSSTVAVWPNPTSGLLYIESPNVIGNVFIHSISGQCVHAETVLGEGRAAVDMTSLPEGVYFVRFSAGSQSYMRKIVKM